MNFPGGSTERIFGRKHPEVIHGGNSEVISGRTLGILGGTPKETIEEIHRGTCAGIVGGRNFRSNS